MVTFGKFGYIRVYLGILGLFGHIRVYLGIKWDMWVN